MMRIIQLWLILSASFANLISGYLSLEEVYSKVYNYSEAYPFILRETVGYTYHNRSIPALRLLNPGFPRILIIGAHHARELISTSQVFYVLDEILSNSSKTLLKTREIWFVPVLNVDGLAVISDIFKNQSRIAEIRKNLRPFGCDLEFDGVDLNRNYGYQWGYDDKGSSKEPCTEEFRGTSAFSELETQAIKNLLEVYMFDAVISYHSYGDMYILPTGYKDTSLSAFPPSHQQLYNEIKSILPSNFRFGSVQSLLHYNANGSLMDYLYNLGIFCIEIEIGPENFNSFHPPETEISKILQTHLKPFLHIASETKPVIKINVETSSRKLIIEISNKGIADLRSAELLVRFDHLGVKAKVLSEHKFRNMSDGVIVEMNDVKSDGSEVVEVLVHGRKEKLKAFFRVVGKEVSEEEVEVEVEFSEHKNWFKVLVVVGAIAFAVVSGGLIGYCLRRRKSKYVRFVELQEISDR